MQGTSTPRVTPSTSHEQEQTCLPKTGKLAIVGGCGHVGLPLGLAFASQGFEVTLIDRAPERVQQVNRGEMPFREEEASDLLERVRQSGHLRATGDHTPVQEADTVIVTVGTPVDEHMNPSVGEFDRTMEELFGLIRPGQLLVLRSTVFPGVTARLAGQLMKRGLGEIDLAYCPERIVQGKSLVELHELPQLVGAVTPRAAERAAALFRVLGPAVLFLEPVEAELAKLFCNAWRYINFAISNQFFVIARQFGADFHRIQNALRQDYPRMKSFARAGFAAGPCLLKDTMQLAAFNQGSFVLGQAAMMINEGLPYLLVQDLKQQFDLQKMCVGVLGMTFKPDSDDPRSSLSYKLRKALLVECQRVLCSDPYVADPNLSPQETVLAEADLIIIGTPHTCYQDLKFRQPVIDITATIQAGSQAP